MEWTLDKSRPICPQICEQVCLRIVLGEFQAGEDDTTKGPLTAYTTSDVEPGDVFGGNR